MPANKKYLNKSGFDKFLKITGGLVLGYSVNLLFFTLLAHYFKVVDILETLRFTGFIVWAGLLLIAFLMKKGWQVWLLYGSITFLLYVLYLLSKIY